MLNEARPYLRFLLNSYPNRNGERLVMLRVRVRQSGQKEKKIDLSTGVRVKPEQWLADKQSLSTKVRSASAYNERLRRYHLEILTFCEKALAAGQDPVDELKKLKTQEPDVQTGLIEFAKEYVKNRKEISRQTRVNYISLIKNLETFAEKNKRFPTLKNIDERFIKDFFWFLIDDLKMGNQSAEIKDTQLRTILNEAARRGLINESQYKNHKIKLKYTNIDIALTEEELKKLMNYVPAKETDQKVLDIFLLLCFTGVRFSDYIHINKDNIKIDTESDIHYVSLLMQKTGKYVTFPLNKYAMNILEKYSYKMPSYDPTPFNKKIKSISKACGIGGTEIFTTYKGTQRLERSYERHNLMSSHVGRRTWATLSYKKGVALEAISKCLGHASISQTEDYLRLKQNDFDRRVSNIWNIMDENS